MRLYGERMEKLIASLRSTCEHDTEDKLWWCEHGLEREYIFVEKVCPMLNIPAMINPEKQYSVYVPDAIIKNKLSDIKSEFLPFFTAEQSYGFNPQYTVTFNLKDQIRYKSLYPDLMIYFWVNWEQTVYGSYKVEPMWGVWEVHLSELCKIIDNRFQTHSYERRINDVQGNAKESYLVDVRELTCLKERPYHLTFPKETE